VVIVILVLFAVVLFFMPLIGRTSSPQRTCSFLALLLLILAGICFHFSKWIPQAFWIGLAITLLALLALYPFMRILVRSIVLPRKGVKEEAVVVSFHKNSTLGASINISVSAGPRSTGETRSFHPYVFCAEANGRQYSFYFSPAYARPEQLVGKQVTVYRDPARPDRYYVDRGSIRLAWKMQ
jgi:hypothetical protein